MHREEGGGFFSSTLPETSDLAMHTIMMSLSGIGFKVLRHQDHMSGSELPHGFLLLQAAAKKVPALKLGDITRGTIKAGWGRSRSERSSHGLDGVGAMSIREAAAAGSAALPGMVSQAKGAALPCSAHCPPCLREHSPKTACMLDISFDGCSSTADLHGNHDPHDLAVAAPVAFGNSIASLTASLYEHAEECHACAENAGKAAPPPPPPPPPLAGGNTSTQQAARNQGARISVAASVQCMNVVHGCCAFMGHAQLALCRTMLGTPTTCGKTVPNTQSSMGDTIQGCRLTNLHVLIWGVQARGGNAAAAGTHRQGLQISLSRPCRLLQVCAAAPMSTSRRWT